MAQESATAPLTPDPRVEALEKELATARRQLEVLVGAINAIKSGIDDRLALTKMAYDNASKGA